MALKTRRRPTESRARRTARCCGRRAAAHRAAYEGFEAVAVIQALDEQHPRKAEVVTLRVLAGRSMPDIARMIGVSLPTAERDWKFAKAWIRNYLAGGGFSA